MKNSSNPNAVEPLPPYPFFKIIKVARKFDRSTGKFTFDVRYKTSVALTRRTIAVAEAFGLGVDEEQEHVVLDNVELKIGPQDVVLISGDSGSGKSVLLNAIRADLGNEAADIGDVHPDPSLPLIETIGQTVEEGLLLLSMVGLNDAFLFLRTYDQLSDGQKYRYRLAKLIESGKQWWVMDEFCATLDRDTAKIIAFNLQKLARIQGKAVIAATTHQDLLKDLRPDVHVHKRFGKEIAISYLNPNRETTCSLAGEMYVAEGSRDDWKKLACFHYRSHKIAMVRKIFKLMRGQELVGVIVYTHPFAIMYGRRRIFPNMPWRVLDRCLSTISRIVIHPKYRTIGLGARLVRETMPLCGTPYVEVTAVMAKYNPFFEHAGMRKVCEKKVDLRTQKVLESLEALGFCRELMASARLNLRILESLHPDTIKQVKELFLSLSDSLIAKDLWPSRPQPMFIRKPDCDRLIMAASLPQLARLLHNLAIRNQVKVYLFWINNALLETKIYDPIIEKYGGVHSMDVRRKTN